MNELKSFQFAVSSFSLYQSEIEELAKSTFKLNLVKSKKTFSTSSFLLICTIQLWRSLGFAWSFAAWAEEQCGSPLTLGRLFWARKEVSWLTSSHWKLGANEEQLLDGSRLDWVERIRGLIFSSCSKIDDNNDELVVSSSIQDSVERLGGFSFSCSIFTITSPTKLNNAFKPKNNFVKTRNQQMFGLPDSCDIFRVRKVFRWENDLLVEKLGGEATCVVGKSRKQWATENACLDRSQTVLQAPCFTRFVLMFSFFETKLLTLLVTSSHCLSSTFSW